MNKTSKSKTSPLVKAYLLTILVFLIPSWTGSGLAANSSGMGDNNPFLIAAVCCFLVACFAPSVGLIYLGKKKYAWFSGIGRIVFISVVVLIDMSMLSGSADNKGHAYLSFLGLVVIFIWGLIDFIRIYFVDANNKKQQATK